MHTVAVAVLKRRDDLIDIQHPEAYLAVCLRRATLNYFRDNSKSLPTDPDLIKAQYADNTSDCLIDYVEWVVCVETYLEKYDDQMRKAFIQHYLDDVPLEVISKSLGISDNTLAKRFARMRKEIKENNFSLLKQILLLSLI